MYKYIYGPVESWRLGTSVGIDPLSDRHKVCNMNCIYCQLGKTTHWNHERQIYVTTNQLVKELEQFLTDLKLVQSKPVEYLTISGRGEPTLAKNLGEIIRALKFLRKEKVSVITNGSLLHRREVQEDLALVDVLIVKFDAYDERSFELIDCPRRDVQYHDILQGIADFRQRWKGHLALQIMCVEENQKHAEKFVSIFERLQPDEVQIDTPFRPCAVKALSLDALSEFKSHFSMFKVSMVYDQETKASKPLNKSDTVKRHGVYEAGS